MTVTRYKRNILVCCNRGGLIDGGKRVVGGGAEGERQRLINKKERAEEHGRGNTTKQRKMKSGFMR